jgi:integrase
VAGVDTKTRYQGVYARHQEGCRVEQDRPCNCTPSYFGTAWDRIAHRTRKTRHFRLINEARLARGDLQASLRKGEVPVVSTITFAEARTRFIKDVKNGTALNKHRRPYKPNAADDLESALAQVSDEIARRRFVRVTRAEIQAMVDARSTGPDKLSSSCISSIVNAIRSLYRWGKERELAGFDPAKEIRLPASDAKPRDRVATPAEFGKLIAAIFETTPAEKEEGKTRDRDAARKDALPFALAGYGSARHQEIQILDWEHLNLDVGGGELAGDEAGRKPGGSWRVIFFVKPLWEMLREEWEAQGRPTRQGLPAEGAAQVRSSCPQHPPGQNPQALERTGIDPDRPARVPPHDCNLARPCRRHAQGDLRIRRPQDAGVSTRRRQNHPAGLHPHAPWRAGAGSGLVRQVPGGAGGGRSRSGSVLRQGKHGEGRVDQQIRKWRQNGAKVSRGGFIRAKRPDQERSA